MRKNRCPKLPYHAVAVQISVLSGAVLQTKSLRLVRWIPSGLTTHCLFKPQISNVVYWSMNVRSKKHTVQFALGCFRAILRAVLNGTKLTIKLRANEFILIPSQIRDFAPARKLASLFWRMTLHQDVIRLSAIRTLVIMEKLSRSSF